MNGWIKLHRKIVNWEWFSDSQTFHVFMYLLIHACQKEKKWRGISVKRGQVITGRKSMAKTLGITEQSIRTCINRLKSTSELTIKTTNRYSVITLVNFEKYQLIDTLSTNQSTSQSPTTNQQLTTSKEDKNIEEVKGRESLFEKFWSQYGKNIDRDICFEKFLGLPQADVDKIFLTLPTYVASTPKLRFRQKPETYLNKKSWNNTISTTEIKNDMYIIGDDGYVIPKTTEEQRKIYEREAYT